MRLSMSRWLLSLVVVTLSLNGWASPAPAADTPAGKAGAVKNTAAEKPEKPGADAPGSKLEKMLASAEDRYTAIQTQELQLSMEVLTIQAKAQQALKDPAKAREELEKPGGSKELRDYKAAMLACAAKWQGFEQKIQGLLSIIKPLEAQRDKAPAELQPRIDQLVSRTHEKHRAVQEKIADCYDKVAAYKEALQAYGAIYQGLPEKQRASDRTLIEKLAGLCEKLKDYKRALEFYMVTYKGKSEKDRNGDRKLSENLSRCYEKLGDMASALDFAKKALATSPDDKGLKERVAKLEGSGSKK